MKLLKIIFNIIFHDKVMFFLVNIYFSIKSRIKRAQGNVVLSKVKNKGNNCKFNGFIDIKDVDKLILSDNVRIGEGGFLFAMGGIKIGNNTQISRNVVIYTGNHDINGNAIPYDDSYILKPVVIGHSVWIGMNVVITPGVTIGDGAIIGMGTVVSTDVPEGAIVVGAKQRIIKYRNMNKFSELNNSKKYFSEMWPNK
jgi:acetyltransferase-like isoleucine patch superfamily enzyme